MRAEYQISNIRRVTGDILLALVILLAADVLFVMPAKINSVVLKADYRKVFMYELMLCAILLLFALDVRFCLFTRWKPAILKGIGWVLRVAIVLLSAVILFFCGRVITGGFINTAGQAEYAIVLGLALENGKPVPDLLARLDTARAYLEKYPEAQLILTGGNADDTGRTEAAVMRDILTEKGVTISQSSIRDAGRLYHPRGDTQENRTGRRSLRPGRREQSLLGTRGRDGERRVVVIEGRGELFLLRLFFHFWFLSGLYFSSIIETVFLITEKPYNESI